MESNSSEAKKKKNRRKNKGARKMNGWVLFAFVFEIWAVMFIVWGAFHEDKLIKFEKRIAERLKRK